MWADSAGLQGQAQLEYHHLNNRCRGTARAGVGQARQQRRVDSEALARAPRRWGGVRWRGLCAATASQCCSCSQVTELRCGMQLRGDGVPVYCNQQERQFDREALIRCRCPRPRECTDWILRLRGCRKPEGDCCSSKGGSALSRGARQGDGSTYELPASVSSRCACSIAASSA